MKKFLDDDFLLESDSARALYHGFAENAPIIDYHCHINPADIAEDKRYDSITGLWLGGDHYKWRAMRCNGIPESEITGAVSSNPYLVFENWIKTLRRAVGNPLYHWSYLELKRYFDIDEIVSEKNCREIYERCNQKLAQPGMSVRGIIEKSNVKLICTTDDPTDNLEVHQKIAADATIKTKVLPAFRPDKALNIDKPGFAAYIGQLAAAFGQSITHFEDLLEALSARIDFFDSLGACVSDHALDYPVCTHATCEELQAIFQKRMADGTVSATEAAKYRTAVLLHLAQEYAKRGWVMQIHFGCIRNNSTSSLKLLGPDSGFDCAGNSQGAKQLVQLLDAMETRSSLPKMVLYSLNQYDNEIIMTIAGSFQRDSGCATKIQLGSAWWFNDHKTGMEKQLTDFANLGVLGNFIGMLTDSRSFLSYTRHEYFRRILCNLIGGWMDSGQLPADVDEMGGLVADICYNNAVKYFGFDI